MSPFSRLRLPGGKRLRFLYVPDDASVRQFMVPKFVIYTLAVGAVATLGLLCFFGSRWVAAAADGRRLLGLAGENAALRAELTQMKSHLGDLRQQMDSNNEVQQRLRVVASLQELSPDVMAAGIGGPSSNFHGSEALSDGARLDLEQVSKQMAQLLGQARVQKESYEEIVTALEDKRSKWDRTPSIRPVLRSTITSHYGRRLDPFTGAHAMHRGIDFAAVPGTPIHASAKGTVVSAERWGGYGLIVEIDHGDGLRTRYAHCQAAAVTAGQRVDRGDVIAYVGSTGKATGTHLHYEVMKSGLHVDPMEYVLPMDVVVD
jgi:murein DD-endopeptidase MepM/ murein hydrolase activator NlpD